MACEVDVQGLLNTNYYVLSTAVLPICRIRNLMRIYPAFLITAYPCFSRAHDGVSPKQGANMKTPLRILSAALMLMVAGAQPLNVNLFDGCPKPPCNPPAICQK